MDVELTPMQIPRASSSLSRASFQRPATPLTSFARWQSTGGEEKVKGQVIGIDLGMIMAACHSDHR